MNIDDEQTGTFSITAQIYWCCFKASFKILRKYSTIPLKIGVYSFHEGGLSLCYYWEHPRQEACISFFFILSHFNVYMKSDQINNWTGKNFYFSHQLESASGAAILTFPDSVHLWYQFPLVIREEKSVETLKSKIKTFVTLLTLALSSTSLGAETAGTCCWQSSQCCILSVRTAVCCLHECKRVSVCLLWVTVFLSTQLISHTPESWSTVSTCQWM